MLLHGSVGRLEEVLNVIDTDDIMLLRDGVLYRVPFSSFGTSGSLRDITDVNATYGVLASDDLVRCTENTFTVTLPVGVSTGKTYTVKNAGIGTITVDVAGGANIDDVTSKDLIQNESLDIVFDGTNYIEV